MARTVRAVPARDGERRALADGLADLEQAMSRRESRHAEEIARVHPDHRADAANLMHYLALRRCDVRSLQRGLGERGLSSLGRCEPHVLATVESVRSALDPGTPPVPVPPALSFTAGRAALDRNTDALFGPRPHGRVPRVMVTLPSEAAGDYELVRHLVSSGMDVARINGAHDGPGVWEQMARNVRKASDEVARPCRISVDLPGPKMRTGPLVEGPRVDPPAAPAGPAGSGRRARPGHSRRRGTAPRRGSPCTSGGCRVAGAPGSVGPDRADRHQRRASTPPCRCLRAGAGRPPRSGIPPTSRPAPSSTAQATAPWWAPSPPGRSITCCARGMGSA